jgi:DNA-binding protein HU-beta
MAQAGEGGNRALIWKPNLFYTTLHEGNMNKSDMIDAVSQYANITKFSATAAIDGLFAGITKALANGETVTLVGFGTFTVKERSARTGRNPATGAVIEIPSSRTVTFKPGKGLKDTING